MGICPFIIYETLPIILRNVLKIEQKIRKKETLSHPFRIYSSQQRLQKLTHLHDIK